jgi:hypothetical protein
VVGRSTALASAGRESVTLHPRDLTLEFSTVGRGQRAVDGNVLVTNVLPARRASRLPG